METRSKKPVARRRIRSADRPIRVLCVHGVGDHHSDTTWRADWQAAIRQSVARFTTTRPVQCDFILYDYIFEKQEYQITALSIASAVWKLSVSGVMHGVTDLFRRQRGLADISSRIRWTAGMVVQWADKPRLRAGRAIPLRQLKSRQYARERDSIRTAARGAGMPEAGEHFGPYLPIILQACDEGEKVYEYVHGVSAHGAFTFMLDRFLRAEMSRGRRPSFIRLRDALIKRMHEMGYPQKPCLVGAKSRIGQKVPFGTLHSRTGRGGGGGA